MNNAISEFIPQNTVVCNTISSSIIANVGPLKEQIFYINYDSRIQKAQLTSANQPAQFLAILTIQLISLYIPATHHILSESSYKQFKIVYIINQPININIMPRTEHLSNLNANRIYALDAQLLYKHETPKMTTAIIQQDNVQSKIKIPNTMMMQENQRELIEGSNYHFAFCYVNPNGWIHVRHPDNSITEQRPEGMDQQPNIRLLSLPEIVNACQKINGNYISTLLYVLAVNPVQIIKKGEKELTLCILNCYSGGYLIDVTLWNFDLPIQDLKGQWIVFSGFRLKKLADQKFVLVSSVYSKIGQYDEPVEGLPYNPSQKYYNLSSIFQQRSIPQILYLMEQNEIIFSETVATIIKIEPFTYEGCSICKKKLGKVEKCPCNNESQMKIYTILRVILEGDGNSIEATVFDEQMQGKLTSLPGPTKLKAHVKSTKKLFNQGLQIAHILTKVFL